MEEQLNMITHIDPKSPFVEAYRMLRTNLQFSQVDKKLQTIAITSATPNEGKSAVITNLGMVLAQAGNKVLIIDCDFRNPTQHKNFKCSNRSGFSSCIATHGCLHEFIQKTKLENVDIVTAGPIPPNPSELLGSTQVQVLLDAVKADYDYVLIDTPPIMPVTDAAIIGAKADGLILVVEYGAIPPQLLREAKERLTNTNMNLLGAVLNKVEVASNRGYGYGYYHYYGKE